MKIISNVILIYSLCASIKYILIEQMKLKDYEKLINIALYAIQFIAIMRILFRLFKT